MQLNKDIFDFLKLLKQNNNTEWFHNNKTIYVQVKSDFELFLNTLIAEISKFDTSVAHLSAKNCTFRINRDIRFSKDKSPYKTNFGAFINKRGKKTESAGYYLHLEPENCFVAGGWYMPLPEELSKIRQEIDYNAKQFSEIINNKSFKKNFKGFDDEMKLKNPPKGYDNTNEMIEYIKLKSFTVSNKIEDSNVSIINIAQQFKSIFPLIQFLNNAIE